MLTTALIHLLLTANIILVIYLAWWYWKHRLITIIEPASSRYLAAKKILPPKKIALLCPTITPAVIRLKQGIAQSLSYSERFSYAIEVLQGQHRNNLTRQLATQALEQEYACIASSGVFSTQILQEELIKQGKETPLIFGNIAETENHIVQHPIAHNWTTGVLHERNIAAEINRLGFLVKKPEQVLIVLPHLTLRWVEKDAQAITSAFTNTGTIVRSHRLTEKGLLPVLNMLSTVNLVIVLGYTLNALQIHTLAKHCAAHNATLYATDIDAVSHGAAIGSGGGEIELGVTMGAKIRLIVEQKIPVHHIPITTQTLHPTIRLNRETCPRQGVALSQTALFIIKQGSTLHN